MPLTPTDDELATLAAGPCPACRHAPVAPQFSVGRTPGVGFERADGTWPAPTDEFVCAHCDERFEVLSVDDGYRLGIRGHAGRTYQTVDLDGNVEVISDGRVSSRGWPAQWCEHARRATGGD